MNNERVITTHALQHDSVNHHLTLKAFPDYTYLNDPAKSNPADCMYTVAHGSATNLFTWLLRFHNGPVNGESDINGLTNEVLLAIIADRLSAYQSSKYASPYNEAALYNVQSALEYLHKRTRERIHYGKEGTHTV